MRFYSLKTSSFKPVSHNPELKKQVLVPDGFSCVRHISHITLKPGSTASSHVHAEAYEVFYCVRGKAAFRLNDTAVILSRGDCLVVEPGETHEISEVVEETELVYFHAAK